MALCRPAMRLASLCVIAVTVGSNGAGAADRSLPDNWDDSYLDRTGSEQSMKPVIAVLPDEVKGSPRNIDIKVSDVLTTALSRSGRFEVAEREKIQGVVAEQQPRQQTPWRASSRSWVTCCRSAETTSPPI